MTRSYVRKHVLLKCQIRITGKHYNYNAYYTTKVKAWFESLTYLRFIFIELFINIYAIPLEHDYYTCM